MSQIAPGATDVTRYIVLYDSITGEPATGLTITDLDLTYVRNRAAVVTAAAAALAAVDSAHADNSAIEVDATNCPGLYRVDWPDAAFAAGADKALLVVTGIDVHPAVEEIDLGASAVWDGLLAGFTTADSAGAALARLRDFLTTTRVFDRTTGVQTTRNVADDADTYTVTPSVDEGAGTATQTVEDA